MTGRGIDESVSCRLRYQRTSANSQSTNAMEQSERGLSQGMLVTTELRQDRSALDFCVA
jgi:hypothetical protein